MIFNMETIEKLQAKGISFDSDQLGAIAREFNVVELSVFGSSVRDTETIPNDIDLLVRFAPESEVSLFDIMDLEKRLEELFGFPVDIVEPQAITNPIRRKSIFACVEKLYAA